jgi:hypothetical protein
MFRDLFLIAELLDSKAESDDVGLERSWLGCPVRSSGLSVWTFEQLECGNVGAFQPRL